MCLNCGCGQPDMRHKDTDITREDVRRAAQGQGQSLEEATANMTRSFASMGAGGQRGQAGTSEPLPSGGRAQVR